MTREWTTGEKSKSAALAYIRHAVEDARSRGIGLPFEVETLLQEWPGNNSSVEAFRKALKALERLGQHHHFRGAYWKRLMRAANMLGMKDLEPILREQFRQALLRLKSSSPGQD
jgi:hypothetical protein